VSRKVTGGDRRAPKGSGGGGGGGAAGLQPRPKLRFKQIVDTISNVLSGVTFR
jgi:hypothetical protein